MELISRSRWERTLVLALSVAVVASALAAGRLTLVSAARPVTLYEQDYARPASPSWGGERAEGQWHQTPEGLSILPGESGTITITTRNESRLVLLLSGHSQPGFHFTVSLSGDGRTYRDVTEGSALNDVRMDLPQLDNRVQMVWLKFSAGVRASEESDEPALLSRLRIVSRMPSVALPNFPVALLLVLTPILAYRVRTSIRPDGALLYSVAVLGGLAVMVESLEWTRLVDRPRWWELVTTGEGDRYVLFPYAVLLAVLGWRACLHGASAQTKEAWVFFALAGILSWGGISRLRALADTAAAHLEPDAFWYVQLAEKMTSPYDTGVQEPFPMSREPFWVWMIKGWFLLVGNSSMHLRLLSLGLSLLLLAVAYKVFRDYTGRPLVGLLVAGLLAANPYLIGLSVRGLREEAYLTAILCFVYVLVAPEESRTPARRAIGLALSGAAAQLLRFNSYVFLIPLLFIRGWKQGSAKLTYVALPLVFITLVSLPHLLYNLRQYGDPMHSVNMHFLWARNFENAFVKRVECEGCPSREEFYVNCCTGPAVGPVGYLFGLHSLREVLSGTLRGYLDMYLRPTDLFEIQSGTKSHVGYAFYLFGLGLVLFGPYREMLLVIILLANAVPFVMALGFDARLGLQTVPFVTFVLAYALWWSFEQALRLGIVLRPYVWASSSHIVERATPSRSFGDGTEGAAGQQMWTRTTEERRLATVGRFERLQVEYFACADDAKFRWQTGDPYLAETERELLAHVPIEKTDRLLEVGCGEGGNLELIPAGPAGAVGVDFSRGKVEWALRHLRGARFVCADAGRLPFRDGSFDVILCRDVLHHVTEKRAVVGEMLRVCRTSGRIAIIEPNGRSPIMFLLGLLIPAERDLTRNCLARLDPLLDRRQVTEPRVIWAQPFPLGRVLFHYRWGAPRLSARLRRIVLAIERWIGRMLPSDRWAYIVLTAVKQASTAP